MNEERKRKIAECTLMCCGNHNYNGKLLNGDMPGEMIVPKRPCSDTAAARFSPATRAPLPFEGWRHVHQCPCATERERQMDNRTLKVLSESRSGPGDTTEPPNDSDFNKTAMAEIKHDCVRESITNDLQLLKLGNSVMINKGKGQSHLSAIQLLLRVLEKLVPCVQKKGGHRHTLETILRPRYFDVITSCVKEVCEWEIADANHPPKYKIPSRALKLGPRLKKRLDSPPTLQRHTDARISNT